MHAKALWAPDFCLCPICYPFPRNCSQGRSNRGMSSAQGEDNAFLRVHCWSKVREWADKKEQEHQTRWREKGHCWTVYRYFSKKQAGEKCWVQKAIPYITSKVPMSILPPRHWSSLLTMSQTRFLLAFLSPSIVPKDRKELHSDFRKALPLFPDGTFNS